MNGIALPRTVCLDTAVLGDVARDRYSKDGATRAKASAFLKTLTSGGYVPVLTLHHLEELLAHENLDVARSRFEFLRNLPCVAWITSSDSDTGPATVVSILIHEVTAAYENPLASLVDIRDLVSKKLFTFGTGAEMLKVIDDGQWESLRPIFQNHQREARHIVAISRSKYVDISGELAESFVNGKLRNPEAAAAMFATLGNSLEADIRARGDKRIDNPAAVAADFIDEVASQGLRTIYSKPGGVWRLLESLEIGPSDIGPQTTMGDLMRLSTFRGRLRVANERLRLDWPRLIERVTIERVPTCYLAESIRQHGQDTPERKGSDLNDVHLATLCFYADLRNL